MDNIEITKREVIASVVIVAFMLIIGFAISENIRQSLLEEYQVYDTAAQIDDKELFEYGMETNIGHAFVYGELKTLDPVSYPEVSGEYSYIKKEEQKYQKHYRYVEEEYKDLIEYLNDEHIVFEMRDNSDLQQRIDKAIEYIKYHDEMCDATDEELEILSILRGKEVE